MRSKQLAELNLELARAQASEAARMVMKPLACWDLFTREQQQRYLEACLANLSSAMRYRSARMPALKLWSDEDE